MELVLFGTIRFWKGDIIMKATQEKEADLGNGGIGKLLFKLALPAQYAK